MVDAIEHVVDVVVHGSHSVVPFFCGWGEEFVFGVEVNGAWIKAIETPIRGEFVGRGGCDIIGKFCQR